MRKRRQREDHEADNTTTGPRDYGTTGPPDPWTTGSRDDTTMGADDCRTRITIKREIKIRREARLRPTSARQGPFHPSVPVNPCGGVRSVRNRSRVLSPTSSA